MAGTSGPEAGARGVAEGIKGRVKQAVGALTGNADVAAEGRAQQDKAEAQREVARAEAEAERARAAAAAHEAEQRAHE